MKVLKQAIQKAKESHYQPTIKSLRNDLGKMYRTVSSLIDADFNDRVLPINPSDSDLADDMATYFEEKVVGIRQDIESNIVSDINRYHENHPISTTFPQPPLMSVFNTLSSN